MFNKICNPEMFFKIVQSGTFPDTREVSIHEIQPTEDYLVNEKVDYFLNNRDKLFEKPILITKGIDARIQYHVRDGNHRLFVLFFIGFHLLEIVSDEEPRYNLDREDKTDEGTAIETVSQGIFSWEQLKSRIVSKKEYQKINQQRY